MKIFAKRFALQLRVGEGHGHFRFERSAFDEAARLLRKGPDFKGQVFYVDAVLEEGFVDAVVALHREMAKGENWAELILCFETAFALEGFFEAYAKRYKPVTAAGGLVVGPGPSLLMMVRDGEWDLPKGKVEAGEAIANGAMREVEEETGLAGHTLGEKAAETLHIYDRGEKWYLKTTHWYYMHTQELVKLKGQKEEGITKVEWVPLADLAARGIPDTYPQIVELVRMVIGGASQ